MTHRGHRDSLPGARDLSSKGRQGTTLANCPDDIPESAFLLNLSLSLSLHISFVLSLQAKDSSWKAMEELVSGDELASSLGKVNDLIQSFTLPSHHDIDGWPFPK